MLQTMGYTGATTKNYRTGGPGRVVFIRGLGHKCHASQFQDQINPQRVFPIGTQVGVIIDEMWGGNFHVTQELYPMNGDRETRGNYLNGKFTPASGPRADEGLSKDALKAKMTAEIERLKVALHNARQ